MERMRAMGNSEIFLSSVMLVSNEIQILPQSLAALFSYSDQVVFVDQGSTDGSLQYLQSRLRPQDRIINVDWGAVYRYGYAYLRNLGSRLCDGVWIEAIDADEVLAPEFRNAVKGILQNTNANVLRINMHQFKNDGSTASVDWYEIAKNSHYHEIIGHRRIYRQDSGIFWDGYIHEELWMNEKNAAYFADESGLLYWHFTEFRSSREWDLKHQRYAWMLVNAFSNVRLQKGTNSGWYERYVPENLPHLQEQANQFSQYLKARGY